MDLIHTFMNLVVSPIILIILCLPLPFSLMFKFALYLFRSFFSENLTGKVVLITGASSGIGEHLAYEYAKRRSNLAIVARRENQLREVAKKARELGSPDVLVICADVSKSDDCKRFVEETINHFGRLDHLVNNAGVNSVCRFQEEASNFAKSATVMDVNFWGSVYPTYFAIPHLKKSKGKIIVNASLMGLFYGPKTCFYGASKAALINFYDTMRIELGPDISITIVTPGFIESDMGKGLNISKEGTMVIDQEFRSGLTGAFPDLSATKCAKIIVDGTCRRDRYVIVPSWYRVLLLLKILYPELLEWFGQLIFMKRPNGYEKDESGKKILSSIGAKNFINPSEIKAD